MKVEEKIKALQSYYQSQYITFLGFNDDRGILSFPHYSLSYFKQLALSLKKTTASFTLVDFQGSFLGRPKYLDRLFAHNVPLRQIEAFGKIAYRQSFQAQAKYLPFSQKLGVPFIKEKSLNEPFLKNKYCSLTQLVLEDHPMVFYSLGTNELLHLLHTSPLKFVDDYQKRNFQNSFSYTSEIAKDQRTYKQVMDAIKKNLEWFLSIDPCIDLYLLSTFVPNGMWQGQNMEAAFYYQSYIDLYNHYLRELSRSYHLTYVDTTNLTTKENCFDYGFLLNPEGHQVLFQQLIDAIYQKEILTKYPPLYLLPRIQGLKTDDKGVQGMMYDYIFDPEVNERPSFPFQLGLPHYFNIKKEQQEQHFKEQVQLSKVLKK